MALNDLLDDIADEILKQDARKNKKSLRKYGIVDERRERTIRAREIPLSSVSEHRSRKW
jgi:hypothetical protein